MVPFSIASACVVLFDMESVPIISFMLLNPCSVAQVGHFDMTPL